VHRQCGATVLCECAETGAGDTDLIVVHTVRQAAGRRRAIRLNELVALTVPAWSIGAWSTAPFSLKFAGAIVLFGAAV